MDVFQQTPEQRLDELKERVDKGAELASLQLEAAKQVVQKGGFSLQQHELVGSVVQAIALNMRSAK